MRPAFFILLVACPGQDQHISSLDPGGPQCQRRRMDG